MIEKPIDTIRIKTFDTEDADYFNSEPDMIYFYERYLLRTWKTDMNEHDDDLGMKKERHSEGEGMYFRDKICGVECSWASKGKYWQIVLSVMGGAEPVLGILPTKKEGIEVRDRILKWLLTDSGSKKYEIPDINR